MSQVVHHIARRGLEVAHDHYKHVQAQAAAGVADDHPAHPHRIAISPAGTALLGGTVLLFLLAMFTINYTYGELIATLTMVETPTATAVLAEEIPASKNNDTKVDEKEPLPVDREILLIKQKPITSKLRTAVRHLRTVGGGWARYRAFHVMAIYHFVHGGVVSHFAPRTAAGPYLRPLVSILMSVLLCRIQMTWTHIAISEPSNVSWFRRFPSWRPSLKVVLPTLVFAVAEQVAVFVSVGLMSRLESRFSQPELHGGDVLAARQSALIEAVVIALAAISTLVCVIPAEVTLKRVHASLLPAEHETIVPCDRTFDDSIAGPVSAADMKSGAVAVPDLGMFNAWRTFGKEARWRLIKLYVKVFALQIVTGFLFAVALVAELRAVMGEDFQRVVDEARERMRG